MTSVTALSPQTFRSIASEELGCPQRLSHALEPIMSSPGRKLQITSRSSNVTGSNMGDGE